MKNYFTEKAMFYCLLSIIIFGGSFLYYWYELDAIYVNPVITYTQGVDPMNFKLEKTEYHRGEMVKYYNSFCKNRNAKATTQWSLVNNMVNIYSPTELKELPINCYPEKQNEFILSEIKTIPLNTSLGHHYFTAVITRTLPDGRVRQQIIRTENFNVIN